MDIRDKLASHLYRGALQLDPLPVPALRLFHASGLSWRLADGVFAWSLGPTAQPSIALSGSVADLKAALETAGVSILFADPDLLTVPSGALLEGSGSSANSSTNGLMMFSSPLWTLLDAYGVVVDEAEANLLQAIDQLYMETADGEILDVWGDRFGVPRDDGEVDGPFYSRIIAEVLRPRNNRYAIERTIRDLTGLLVTLREPYREIFKLDFSALSDTDHLQDGAFYTWNVFQPIYHQTLTVAQRARVLAIINRNRPAGCLIVGEFATPPIGYAVGNFFQWSACQIVAEIWLGYSHYTPTVLSSSLSLSNGWEDLGSSFEWILSGNIVYSFGGEVPLGIFQSYPWSGSWGADRAWNAGSIYAVVTQESV